MQTCVSLDTSSKTGGAHSLAAPLKNTQSLAHTHASACGGVWSHIPSSEPRHIIVQHRPFIELSAQQSSTDLSLSLAHSSPALTFH
mmetsp:Transcript_27447/g.70726  ORF Transcript_27447/g.70726 Transcript_27447/m.70726 type:complete len:86 (+) Transcript_27447:373-630(+)